MTKKISIKTKLFIVILLLLHSTISIAKIDSFQGSVIGVVDGDTIEVMRGSLPVKIRLEGIDCPESKQPFGAKAKSYVLKNAAGSVVLVESNGNDRYGRIIGKVFLENGENLNENLVRDGYAWWYRKYSNDLRLRELEANARESKIGLWVDTNPIPPWEWRKQRHTASSEDKTLTGLDEVYHGNTKSHKFHNRACRDFNCKNCTMNYLTREEAVKAGYKPCGLCKP